MAKPSRWDEYETTLLIEAYIKISEGGEIKIQVLQELSDNLRQMAVNKGLEIDEVYRNLNGMIWQYSFIEKSFKKSSYGNHLPAKVFRNVVEMYENNREKFDELLEEAKKRVNASLEFYKLNEKSTQSEKMVPVDEKDDMIVDFSKQGIYRDTRPFQVSYAGEEPETVRSWMDVYVMVRRYLLKDYPNAMDDIADSFIIGDSEAIVAYCENADRFICPLELGEGFVLETDLPVDNIICNIKILLEKSGRSYGDLKIHYRKLNGVKNIVQNHIRVNRDEYKYQKEISMILKQHYEYGYRINSSIELKRFKNFAEQAGIELPNADEWIRAEIRNVGNLIGDKVYLISNEILCYLSKEFHILYEEGHNIFFYECVFRKYLDLMEENHISSEDMLKEILKQNRMIVFAEFNGIYFARNFISLIGQVAENEAVAAEIIRCWGNISIRESNSFLEELPYIPEDIIKRYLSMNRKFAWVSEGLYVLVDKLIISHTEERDIYDYVLNACTMNGFASISDIPLGNLIEENYELTSIGLLTAIYNKILFRGFHLNGKIITKEKSDLDVVTLVKVFLEDKQTCTFDEANQKVIELAGGKYRYMAYDALYDSLVRINKDNYVDDFMVHFDVDAIDQVLTSIITDRGFIALKEVTTFALFPMCNYAWNHYLLESYCYRFSNKYSLRYRMLNDKNSAIIAEKDIPDDYVTMLAKAVARVDIPLQTELVGKYLVDTGYTAKKKFAGLENVIEKAALIREEI